MATSILLRSLRHRIVPSASSLTHKLVAGNAIPSSSLPMGHKWGSFAQTFSSKPAASNSIDLGTTNTSSSPKDGKAVTNPKRLQKRPLRQFTMGSAKSAGRNSSGRITIFHRGGGSKRLQRTIDEKRSTSSIGVVERVEYDPNRSSQIALVRWIEGVHPPRQRKQNTIEEFDKPSRKILEPTTTTVRGRFSFSSLPGKVDQRREASSFPGHMASYAMVGLSSKMLPQLRNPLTIKDMGNKKTCCKDIFFSAFSSSKSKGETTSLPFSESFDLPRMAVAGAKPAFFTPRVRGESMLSLCEVRKMRTNHQMKRKAAVSWQSFRQQETLRLVGSNPKPKIDLKLPGKSSVESISLGQPVPTSSPATSSVESISLGQPVSASSPPLA